MNDRVASPQGDASGGDDQRSHVAPFALPYGLRPAAAEESVADATLYYKFALNVNL